MQSVTINKKNYNNFKYDFIKILIIILLWTKARFLYYVNNWVYTTNHKRIAVNYFWFVILAGIFGMVLATIIRLELAYPGVGIFAGDSLQYLSLVTAHGVIMVFFMIIPLISGAFANFLLPTQLGVHDVAFPRLNSAAFWFLPGGLLMLGQLICVDRRYQRMNAFNIREIQSILKKKFFSDLINTHDHHTLINKTMIGLRFKTNDLNSINYNSLLFYNYGTEVDFKFKSNLYQNETKNDLIFFFNSNFFFYKCVVFLKEFKFYVKFNFFINNLFSDMFVAKDFILLFKNSYAMLNLLFFAAISFDLSLFKIILFKCVNSIINFFKAIYNNFIFFFSKKNINAHIINFLENNVHNFVYFYYLKKDFYSKNWLYVIIENVQIFWNNYIFENLDIIYKTEHKKHLISNINEFLFINRIKEFSFFIYIFVLKFKNIFYYINLFTTACKNKINQIQIDNSLTDDFKKTEIFLNNVNLLKSDFFITDKNHIFKNYWSNDILHQHGKNNLGIKKVELPKELDFSSRFVYIYILLNIWYNIPFYTTQIILSIFDYEKATEIANDFYSFMINWYIPLIFTDNVFTFYEIFEKNHKIRKFLITFLFYFLNFLNSVYVYTIEFFSTIMSLPYKFNFKTFIKYIFLLQFEITNIFKQFIVDFFNTFSTIFFSFKIFFIFDAFYLFFKNFSFKSLFVFVGFDKNFYYSSTYFNNIDFSTQIKYVNQEHFLNKRYQKFLNPLFKYDFKSGDYFPKLNKESYTYLFSTILNITGGIRTSPWYQSFNFLEIFDNNFNNFFENITKTDQINSYSLHTWNSSYLKFTNSFYNFFYVLNNEDIFTNKKWISSDSLTQKFHKMFFGSSMQQRIYSNWKQLKFTREAWRCKLLSARHQKTLLKRYVHEDGIFWSIERNARDLLPGWAMITPFSSRVRYTAIGKTDIGLFAVFLVLNSSIISAANFLVTYRYLSTLNNRKMRDSRSFFTEGIMCTSWMMLAANPMLAIGILMLLSDRHWQTSFFDYSGGGDTVLFQHMFWFFGHPEVYIVIIPCFGFTNTIISYFLKKRISARASLLYSMYTIAFLGFFVWGHHMYMVGLAHTTRMLFSTLTVMISVPAATKIMHWCVTLANSAFTLELPLLCILTFVFLFISGGISGMCVAHTGMDVLFHDTFYVIGHFHIMFAGAAMFACFAAFYFYFPAIFGVKYSRIFAYLHYMYYLIGHLMTFIPMFWLGYAGMPRRILDYPSAFGGWHSVISAGHMLSVAGLISFFIMIFDSLRQAKTATRNTFGISRYNTRFNFYLYENAKSLFVQRKTWFLFRFLRPSALKLNKNNYENFEYYETVLLSYTFKKKK